MNLSQTESVPKKLRFKAFTLIELIVVIAIIAVLASMISLFISGFVRDANLETYNNNAQLSYTAIQDCLIQWEIRQDNTCVDVKSIASGSPTLSDPIEYVSLRFSFDGGAISDTIIITTTYKSGAESPVTLDFNSATANNKKMYEKLAKYLSDGFSGGITGRFDVYVDYKNYTVDSAMFLPNNTDFSYEYTTDYTNKTHKWSGGTYDFLGCKNMGEQRNDYKSVTQKYGCYPYLDSIGTVT